MFAVTRCWLVVSLMMLASPARAAQEAVSRESGTAPGYHTHDGFFLRFTPGLSYGTTSATYKSRELSLSGTGIAGSLALGGAISRNLILCGESTALTVPQPTVKVNGKSPRDAGTTSWQAQYLGAGLSYYNQQNYYLHVGVAGALMAVSAGAGSATTKIGGGMKLLLGKEWWTTDNWGLGLAAQALVALVPDAETSFSLFGLGLALSATYN